jgi:hypothetical protein
MASAETLAGRLVRLLWNSDSADGWVLEMLRAEPLSPSRVREVASRMMDDARAREGVATFYRWWLMLDSLPPLEKVDPDGVLDAELRTSMTREAPALGVALTFDGPGTFVELLTADFTYVDERLARHYEMTGVTGPEMRRAPYPPEQRRTGVLGGAGVLTLFASLGNPSWPAKRGWLVIDPLLCAQVPSAFVKEPSPDATRSLRQQMIDITASQSCMQCHRLLNAPGFAFTQFDTFGRSRVVPGVGPDDTAGWIPEDIWPDRPSFADLGELARLLARREEVRRCFVRQWLQFALDRAQRVAATAPADGSSVDQARAEFEASSTNLRELVLAVTRTEAFVRR